jgi:hypothetical protein
MARHNAGRGENHAPTTGEPIAGCSQWLVQAGSSPRCRRPAMAPTARDTTHGASDRRTRAEVGALPCRERQAVDLLTRSDHQGEPRARRLWQGDAPNHLTFQTDKEQSGGTRRLTLTA